MVQPEISKILEPTVIHKPGRLWLYALLKCFAEYPSAPCFDQGVQLGQLSGHELNGVVGEVDLPAAPNKAVLELRLFP